MVSTYQIYRLYITLFLFCFYICMVNLITDDHQVFVYVSLPDGKYD